MIFVVKLQRYDITKIEFVARTHFHLVDIFKIWFQVETRELRTDSLEVISV